MQQSAAHTDTGNRAHKATFRPLSDRALKWLADAASVPPILTGVIASLALGGLALWITWAIGTVDDVAAGRSPDIAVRAPVTLYMMIGYLPVAIFYLGRWTGSHFQTIAHQFALDHSPVLFPRKLANVFGTLGLFTMYFFFLHAAIDPLLLFQPQRWSAEFAFLLLGLLTMGWFIFRFMFLLIWMATAISRTAQRILRIDLFDVSLVVPYAQQGVRSSLLAVICLSISGNLWLDPNSPTLATGVTVVMLVAAAILALFLPTWGIHKRLKLLKQAALKQVRRSISSGHALETRSVDDAHQLRADLALERRLNEVSEWPFDAGSYGRVALYVFLGFGSWVGAALVERLLESLGT